MNGYLADQPDLATFLANRPPLDQHVAIWAGGAIELDVATYSAEGEVPPVSLATSGRCIVLGGQSVLLMSNEGGDHILPGGRIEPGETVEETTRREISEEAGLELPSLTPLGFMVFRHRTPMPAGYPYPYPLFTNIIYVAQLGEPHPLSFQDDYEVSGSFIPIERASEHVAPHELQLLQLAQLAHNSRQ